MARKGNFKQIYLLLTEHHASKFLHTQNKKAIMKMRRYMPKPEALSICLINLRSHNNKTALMKQFINDLYNYRNLAQRGGGGG